MQNKEKKQRKSILQLLFKQPQREEPTKQQKKELSAEEKETILKNKLANFFADHDKISGEVNLFPLTRANEEVEKWKKEGTFDYYFEWFLLWENYLKDIAAFKQNMGSKRCKHENQNCFEFI